MYKKIVATFLALVMLTGTLAGCGVVQNEPTGNSDASTTSTTTESTSSAALEGADIVLKVSHTDNDISLLSNTWNCYARTFKTSLETLSGGTMSAELFPNNQLGDETSVIEQCTTGSVDVVVGPSTGNFSVYAANMGIFDIPYLISSLDAGNMVCQGEIFDQLSSELREGGNMELLSILITGFRNLDTWDKPVSTVADVKGLKMRIQNIEVQTKMVSCWGAIPTSVAFSELFSAASTGVIDAFEQANYALLNGNLYEAVKYITETNHLANACTVVISSKTMDKLTDEQKAWVKSAANEARRATLGVVTANGVNVTETFRNAGIEIISLTDEQKAGFKDACYDTCSAIVLSSLDSDFYDKFMDEYAAAAEYLGVA